MRTLLKDTLMRTGMFGPTGKRLRVRSPASRWTMGGVLACGLTLLSTGVVLAATPGTWSLTGSMAKVHSGATLLPSGKVLAFGGGPPNPAELYNPVTSTWSQAGQPIFSPDSAVVLASGKVLAVGGTSAKLYDPSQGTWSLTGSALFAPQTLTLLPDGHVLGVGISINVPGNVALGAELYDPGAGKWTLTGIPLAFSGPLRVNAAIELPSGKVLTLSGVSEAGIAQLYEPSTGKWSAAQAGVGSPAILLGNGKVLTVGSEHGGGSSGSIGGAAELYDPRSDTSTSTASFLGFPHSLTLLADGRVLAAGGDVGCGMCGPIKVFNSAQLYDTVTATWTSTGSMIDPEGRPGHSATLLRNGSVLAAGGGTNPLTAEIYTPPSTSVAPTSCALSLSGKDDAGRAFIRVAARDIASGLQAVKVLTATNATVTLPQFPPGYRDPAVVTATKINSSQPSVLKLQVTNRAGKTLTCDPVMATLVGQRHGSSRQVFSGLEQAENKILLKNDAPGLEQVDLWVNGHHFRLADLEDGETRTLDVASAMRPGNENTIIVKTHGPQDSSGLLVVSDSSGI